MPAFATTFGLVTVGIAALNASAKVPTPGSRESANVATFLFAVIGILLFLFFTVVLLITVSRAIRRKRAAEPDQRTDVSVDAWSEAGKRYGRPRERRGRGG